MQNAHKHVLLDTEIKIGLCDQVLWIWLIWLSGDNNIKISHTCKEAAILWHKVTHNEQSSVKNDKD